MPRNPRAALIAIVDDDPGVRGSLDSLLRSAGLAGRSFSDAQALLSCTGKEQLACIITDVQMRGLSGIELMAELLRQGWRQPVIVMTAFPSETVRAQALAHGAVAFLPKPIDPDALLSAVARALG